MNNRTKPITILMADDDPDDRQLTREAFEENHLANDLRFVEDGEELMDYLHQRGKYAAEGAAPLPGLILLDLNMPRKDGREALQEIKSDPRLRNIRLLRAPRGDRQGCARHRMRRLAHDNTGSNQGFASRSSDRHKHSVGHSC